MSYELPAEALQWRRKVRAFVDSELQPLELQAEMNEGRIPAETRKRHEKFAIDAGITLMDTPFPLAGWRCRCSPKWPSSNSLAG